MHMICPSYQLVMHSFIISSGLAVGMLVVKVSGTASGSEVKQILLTNPNSVSETALTEPDASPTNLLSVKGSILARQALADDLGGLVYEDSRYMRL